MRVLLQIISWIALAGTIVPSILYCMGQMPLDRVKTCMLLSTIVWLVITPLWMGKEDSQSQPEQNIMADREKI